VQSRGYILSLQRLERLDHQVEGSKPGLSIASHRALFTLSGNPIVTMG